MVSDEIVRFPSFKTALLFNVTSLEMQKEKKSLNDFDKGKKVLSTLAIKSPRVAFSFSWDSA